MKIKFLLMSAIMSAIILLAIPIINIHSNIAMVEAAKSSAKLNMPNLSKTPAAKNSLNKTQSSANPKPAQSPANSTKNPAAPAKNESKSVSGGGNTYKPSKSAKDLPQNAPTTKSNTNATTNSAKQTNAAAQTNNNSGFSNTLKNIGLFASGMMLGGFLGSLFGGLGGGFLGDVFGLLFNLAIFYAIYRGGRYLWNRYHNGSQTKNKTQNYQPIDITPPQAMNYPNQSSLGTDYDPKRTAEYYRSR